jgi:mRNA interferase RelE/StbE
MTYKLKFHPDALKEWEGLPSVVKGFFKKKIKERLESPHNPKARLSRAQNIYKIKIKNPPFRLTYHVNDNELIVTALSIGKRDKYVYRDMLKRL